MKKTGSGAFFWLKILVSLGLLAFLAFRTDLAQIFRVLASVDFSYVAIVLLAYLLSQILSCFRWFLLARPLGFRLSFGEFLSLYFIGMFFNLFAPSTIGGDVGRVFYLARGAGSEGGRTAFTAHAMISVVADRAIGMGVLVWMGAVAVFVFSSYSVPPAIRYVTYSIAVATLLAGLAIPLFGRYLRREGDPFRNSLSHAMRAYWESRFQILQALLASVAVHLIQAGLHKVLGLALGLNLPWSFCFILYPLVGTFSALPISFNGIGLREGGYLFLFRLIGVGSEKAVAFGLLWFVIVVLDSLIGGLFFVFRKDPRPSSSPSMERL